MNIFLVGKPYFVNRMTTADGVNLHITRVSQAITAFKRSKNLSREEENKKHRVCIETLLNSQKDTVSWFNKTFCKDESIAWLKEFCSIEVNSQQGRGGRQELWITKKSKFRVEGVKNYLKCAKITKNMTPHQHITG